MNCEVKNCRREEAMTLLGVAVCDQCYEKFCEGEVLPTKKGTLCHCQGKGVLTQ